MPETKKRTVKLKGPMFRTARVTPVARAADDASDDPVMEFDIVMSTEALVRMYDWWTGEDFYEVLGHEEGECDLSYMRAGGAFLEEHRGKPIGVVRKPKLDDAELSGKLRLSRNPAGVEAARDMADGIGDKISIGYEVRKYLPMGKHTDGLPIRRAVDWIVYEASRVGIPADLNAGKRAKGDLDREILVEIEGDEPVREERAMLKKVRDTTGNVIEVEDTDPRPAITEAQETRSVVAVLERERDERVADIRSMCETNGMPELTAELVATHGEAVTRKQAADEIMKRRATTGPAQPNAEAVNADQDAQDFSMADAVRCALLLKQGKQPSGAAWRIHERLHAKMPETYAYKGGVLVPMRLGRKKRTMGSKVAGAGAELVYEEHGEFLDMLRPRSRVIQLGARVMTGLTGPISWPKQTEDVEAYWMAENPPADVPDSEVGLGTILMTPRTVMSTVLLPRQLLMQDSFDSEQIVKDSMAYRTARMIDKAALYGLGVQGQPRGIMHTDDVKVKAMGGAPTHAKLTEMASEVVDAEADLGNQSFLTTAPMAGKLKVTPVLGSTFPTFLWQGNFRDGNLTDYPAFTSGNVSKVQTGLSETGGAEHGIFFGSWNQLVIGFWGVMELIVDELTGARRGQIRITSFQMVDVVLLYPEAFSVATGATV